MENQICFLPLLTNYSFLLPSEEIVFSAVQNVGKSTLINSLLERKIAKVSAKPGKTRSINFYNVDTGGRAFHLVDIPGWICGKRI